MAKALIVLFLIIFTVHFPALEFDWYYKIPWFDVPMHIAGGFWVGLLFYYLFVDRLKKVTANPTLPYLLLGLGFVALVGVLWEFLEFFLDVWVFKTYAYNAFPGYIHFDTLTDLLNDFIGGAAAIGFLRKRKAPPGNFS